MDRKESPKDNVPFLLSSLVRPIGRSVPGKCQENQIAAIKCHSSAFSPGGETRSAEVWGPKNFPPWCSSLLVVGAHDYRAINNRMEIVLFEFPFLPFPLQTSKVDGP